MGGGWFDAMGGGWFDAMGGGWIDSGAASAFQTFAMRADRPLVADDTPTFMNPKYPIHAWDSDLMALTFLPQFFTAKVNGQSWDQVIKIGPPPPVIPSGSQGGPADDKPDVTLAPPDDPDRGSSFVNIRVRDIEAVYSEWSARGMLNS